MIRGFTDISQLKIGKDSRVKFQTSPSDQLNFNESDKNLRPL
jgi:hypothetical protein